MDSIASMPLAEFLDGLFAEGRDLRMFLYNLARHIPELLGDLTLPDLGLGFSKRFERGRRTRARTPLGGLTDSFAGSSASNSPR